MHKIVAAHAEHLPLLRADNYNFRLDSPLGTFNWKENYDTLIEACSRVEKASTTFTKQYDALRKEVCEKLIRVDPIYDGMRQLRDAEAFIDVVLKQIGEILQTLDGVSERVNEFEATVHESCDLALCIIDENQLKPTLTLPPEKLS